MLRAGKFAGKFAGRRFLSNASQGQKQFRSRNTLYVVGTGAVATAAFYLGSATNAIADSAVSEPKKISEDAISANVEHLTESNVGLTPEGPINQETGEINWDCPCLGGMATGPCGPEFKEAFSCFVYSTQEPKGIECVPKFQAMTDCFKLHPDVYADMIQDDDDAAPTGLAGLTTQTDEVVQNPDGSLSEIVETVTEVIPEAAGSAADAVGDKVLDVVEIIESPSPDSSSIISQESVKEAFENSRQKTAETVEKIVPTLEEKAKSIVNTASETLDTAETKLSQSVAKVENGAKDIGEAASVAVEDAKSRLNSSAPQLPAVSEKTVIVGSQKAKAVPVDAKN